MTVRELAAMEGFSLQAGNRALDRDIGGIFCCDLLSIAMSKASAGCAWVTVMGNVNAVAVAALTELSCIVLAEGMPLDDMARAKAHLEDIAVLSTTLPVFEAAKRIDRALGNA